MLVESELRKNDTCRRLIAAASEQFAQHGFASARVRDIADAASVNLAAVNYYFGGKEGLYRATVSFLAGQSPAANPRGNRRGRTAEDRLHRRIYGMLERFLKPGGHSTLGRILAHEAIHPTTNLETVVEAALRPELEKLQAALLDAAGGSLPEKQLVSLALSVLGQCLLPQFAGAAIERLYPAFPKGADLCRLLARHITDMTLAGLREARARGMEGSN